jgi:hypothetical protein
VRPSGVANGAPPGAPANFAQVAPESVDRNASVQVLANIAPADEGSKVTRWTWSGNTRALHGHGLYKRAPLTTFGAE